MPLDTAPGQDGRGDGAPPVHDEQSAATAIAGLLDFENEAAAGDDEHESGADGAEETGTEETPSTGDEDEGQNETPAENRASIVPPASWSADDKAVFSKLPPEAQAVIARRESERDSAFTRRAEEIANERKGWDAERQAIATQREQYAQHLQQLVHLALPEAKVFEGVDWARLAAENPAEYVRLNGLRDQLRGRIGAIQQEIARVSSQAQAEQQQQLQRTRAEQQQLLVARVPEFGDADKGPKLAADLRQSLASHYGFSDAEIGNALDHRLIAMAVDAMKYRQGEAARASATAKKANPPPSVQRPGSAPATDAKGRRIAQKVQNLGRTNSVHAAAALLEELI
jgi:hypothetical protein